MPEPINAGVARLIQRANTALAHGEYAGAQHIAREALKQAGRVVHRPTRMAAHYTLATTLWADETASVQEAHQHAAQALEIAQPYTEEHDLAMILLARIEAGLGNLAQAQELNKTLLETYRRKNRQHGVAEILRNLGDIALKQQALSAARSYFQQSLTLYENNVDDPLSHAGLLLSLGTLAYLEGQLDEAQGHWQSAQALGEQLGVQQVIGAARRGLTLLVETATEEHQRGDS